MSEQRDALYELFSKKMIAKVEGADEVGSVIEHVVRSEEALCVGVRCAHGEVVFFGSIENDRERYFLRFIQVFDGIFQEYTVLTELPDGFREEWSQAFRVIKEDGEGASYTVMMRGHFTAFEEQLMRMFVTSNERIECRLICAPQSLDSLTLEIESLRVRIKIEAGERRQAGCLYRIVGRSSSDVPLREGCVWLGTVSVSLSKISDLISGKPILLSLPPAGEGLRLGEIPECVTFEVDGAGRVSLYSLKENPKLQETFSVPQRNNLMNAQ